LNLDNLFIGEEIKNYKVLCKMLMVSEKAGKSRECQLKDFKRYFNWEKSGQKFIITDIYDKPLAKEDKRKLGNNRGKYSRHMNGYQVSVVDSVKKGVYKIQKDNIVYIGSTAADTGFRRRYLDHLSNYQNSMPHTQKLLKSGGIFSTLWIAENNETEEIRRMEQFYLNQYRMNGYEVINRTDVIIPGVKKTQIPKYKSIKILKKDYERALQILNECGIYIA
jgi:hypothetical protein